VERDPAQYISGLNLYQYSNSNPVSKLDPSGLNPTGPQNPPANQPNDAPPATSRPAETKPPESQPVDEVEPPKGWNDPSSGCGVVVKQNIEGGAEASGSNAGHRWIEFWDPHFGSVGLGYWPAGWYCPSNECAPPAGSKIRHIKRNDPHTGKDVPMQWESTRIRNYGGIGAPAILKFGNAAGTDCNKANCIMIRDCLRHFFPEKPWSSDFQGITNEKIAGYTCRNAAEDAIKSCCLATLPSRSPDQAPSAPPAEVSPPTSVPEVNK
jgi:hypothetical protein